jgi:2'-5' RNA ligase
VEALEFFALVAYLPEPLSGFVSRLRHDLDPCFAGKPHLTVLPPRPLEGSWSDAWSQVRASIEATPAFEVGLSQVETFAESQVVYLAIREGYTMLQKLHEQLNSGPTCFAEAWHYQPHITLAHGIAGEQVDSALETARRRWREYSLRRSFEVGRLTWVKTVIVPGVSERGTRSLVATNSTWVDLAECDLSQRVEA